MKKKLFALALSMSIFATGCGSSEEPQGEVDGTTDGPVTEDSLETIPGGPKVVEDGIFRNVYVTEFTTLDYNNASTATVTYHADLTICTLLEYDKYGILQPNLATDWTVSDDGTVYTFNLRDDINWRTLDGEVYAKMTAHDFVDTAEWMLIAENASIINGNLIAVLKNAKEFNEGTVTDFAEVGIKALDDYTLEYTLTAPTPYFMSMLTYASFYPANGQFREEMGDSYGTSNDTILYSGPYTMSVFEPESRRTYERYDEYYNADAYSLAAIEEVFNKEAATIAPEMFLRNEIDEADITTDIVDNWVEDPELYDILYNEPAGPYTYFHAFNFDPRYGEEYNPDNWTVAVNNLNFRKSFFHAVDQMSLAMTVDPYAPELRLTNTFVLEGFANVNGVDYTELDALKDISGVETFDTAKAVEYKELAMEELADTVTFPVQVVMPYNTGSLPLTNRAQLLKQQLESTLGTDYIEVVLVAYPSTGYSAETRNAGVWSFFEANWGPDYMDPMSVLDPFNCDIAVGQRYGRVILAEEGLDENGEATFQNMLNEANAEVLDLEARYNLFAEAERYLIDNAYAVPFYRYGYDYYVSRLDPFSGFHSMSGQTREKYAGKVLLDRPYTREEFAIAQEQYIAEREAALLAAAEN